MRPPTPLAERFWPKVNKTPTCWLWLASKMHHGYGRISLGGGEYGAAHRVAWMLTYGVIPAGMCVLHRCDTTSCVRPDHLFLGTQADNMRDMTKKQRHWLSRDPHQCPHGQKHYRTKLTDEQVVAIRMARQLGQTFRAIAERFHSTVSTVSQICYRTSWRHLP